MNCPQCGAPVQKYKNPVPTVDIIIRISGGLVLIERANPPLGWALPGGFVDYGETLEQAALREAKEETGLELTGLAQFHTYSDPRRDARLHTISTVFVAQGQGELRAGDDARKARIFTVESLPPLVFDHGQILDDYLNRA